MNNLSTSTYSVYTSPESLSLSVIWEQKDTNEDNLRQALQHIVHQLKSRSTQNVLLDYAQLHTDFSGDLKKWIAQKWVPAIQGTSLQKLAIVLDNRLSQWFIEDVLQNVRHKRFKVAYFHNAESARRWLNI